MSLKDKQHTSSTCENLLQSPGKLRAMFLRSQSFAIFAKNKNKTLLFYWQPVEHLVFALLPASSTMGTCGLLGQVYEVNSHFWEELSCHQQPWDRDELEAVGLPASCCSPAKGAETEATPSHEGALWRLAPELSVGR